MDDDTTTNGGAVATAADQLAAEIKRRREAAGFSQRELARRTTYSREYVCMAERAGQNIPSSDLVRAIDAALDADGALIALREAAKGEQATLRFRRQESPEDRLGLISLLASRQIGAADVDNLYLHTARFRRLDDMFGGGDTYSLYSSLAEQTERILQHADKTESNDQRLKSLLAEQHQLAGWAAFDAGNHSRAQFHYTTSREAAESAEDAVLAGNALAFLAYQQTATAEDATANAEASYERASSAATPRVAALLLERKAWAYAVAGDAREVDVALNLAREALQQDDDRPEPDWVFWVDSAEIDIMTGRCWTELGRPLRSVPILERVLSGFSDTHGRDKALYLTWLASSYMQASEVEQAATTLVRAHDLSNGVASVRPQARIEKLARQLRRHRRVASVAEALERIGV